MSKCLNCNKENPPSKRKERKYCSTGCSKEYYKKEGRYKKDPWVRKYQIAEEGLLRRKEKYEDLLKTHMTANQIFQKFGISPATVNRRTRVLGIVPLRHAYQAPRDHYSAEQVEKIVNFETLRCARPAGYIDRKELLSELQIHEMTLVKWFRKFGKIPNTITAQGTSNPNKEFYNIQAVQQWMDDIEKYRQESADTKQAEKLARESAIESERLLVEREYKKKVKGLVPKKEIPQLLGYKSFTPRMQQYLIENEIDIFMPTFGKKLTYYPVREVEKLKGILDAEKQERELKKRERIKNRYPQLGQPQEELYEDRIKRKIIKKHEMGLLRNQQEIHYYKFLEQVKEIESGIKIYKKCKDCKEEKEITEYYVDLTYTNCRRHSCKECDSFAKSSPSSKYARDEVLRVTTAFLNMIKKEMSKHTGSHFYMPQFEIWHELEKHCGYDKRVFIEHIESQFEPWMSWGHNGRVPAGKERKQTWQIDHVLPRVSFFYTKFSDEQFVKCWTLSNIRVVDSVDNSEKGFLDQRRFGKTLA